MVPAAVSEESGCVVRIKIGCVRKPAIQKISIIYYVLSLIYYLKNIDIPSPFRYNKFNFHTKGDFHNELQSLGR